MGALVRKMEQETSEEEIKAIAEADDKVGGTACPAAAQHDEAFPVQLSRIKACCCSPLGPAAGALPAGRGGRWQAASAGGAGALRCG